MVNGIVGISFRAILWKIEILAANQYSPEGHLRGRWSHSPPECNSTFVIINGDDYGQQKLATVELALPQVTS